MEILRQIQSDILDQGVHVSVILRKAKVLAAQLDSRELGEWVSAELDGYNSFEDLPDYRKLHTSIAGQWTNGYWMVNNHSVPLFKIEDKEFTKKLTLYPVFSGIRSVENLVTDLGDKRIMLPPDTVAVVNTYVGEQGYGYSTLHYTLDSRTFDQILDTVRNRLLDFILKLDKQWISEKNPPAQSQVRELVNVTIYNRAEGGTMTVFDQRGQSVQYQFNAAGDINLSSVKTINDFSQQLKKIMDEIQLAKDAKVVSEEIAVEAKYHILQANKEAEKKNPSKEAILAHIGKAKDIFGDLAAAVGLVKTITEAASVISHLLH